MGRSPNDAQPPGAEGRHPYGGPYADRADPAFRRARGRRPCAGV